MTELGSIYLVLEDVRALLRDIKKNTEKKSIPPSEEEVKEKEIDWEWMKFKPNTNDYLTDKFNKLVSIVEEHLKGKE